VKALVRGSDLIGLPVVTLAGDDVAEVRDVLFDPTKGEVIGFTLNKRGKLARRLNESLPRDHVSAIGPNAVMIANDEALSGETPHAGGSGSGDVLGDRVLTDSGVLIGTVTDAVIDTGSGAVVGYEIAPADEQSGRNGRRSYVPLDDTCAVSGEALIVPASAVDYVTNDLAGFAEAVDRFRNLLHRDGK
jgi:uncharacterized protein YrrD